MEQFIWLNAPARSNVLLSRNLNGEAADAKRRFEKEAAILYAVKGHRNISCFLKFYQEPHANLKQIVN